MMISDATIRSAKAALQEMAQDPKPAVRRVVVVPGYRSHARLGRALGNALRRVVTTPEWIIDQGHASCSSFESSAKRVTDAIDRAWGLEEPIDFVGVSMAGLLGRYLAMPKHAGLHVARLFTISTPHRGANAARIAAPDDSARAMIPGSPRLAELDQALQDARYEMRCYGRTRDWWVGSERLEPPGQRTRYVRTPLWEPGHFMASYDARLIADIARHIRGEKAFL